MRNQTTLQALLGLAAAAVLAGCGGGGDGDNDFASAVIPSFPAVLAQLNTPAGLANPQVAEVFDDRYLDAGTTKGDVLDALGQDAAALSADPAYSLFPQATLSDAALTDCDPQDVCTLTGTLRNADADETSVPFSTKVVRIGNAYRLLGDQAAS